MTQDSKGAASFSRRALVARAVAATGALVALPDAIARLGLEREAQAATTDLVSDTINGLVAFVVPGPDAYSVAQGESTPEPGGIDAFATPALIQGLTFAQPSQPLDLESAAAALRGVLGRHPAHPRAERPIHEALEPRAIPEASGRRHHEKYTS